MGSRHREIFRTVVLLTSLLAQKKICLPFSLFTLLVRPLAKKISCEGNLSLRLLMQEARQMLKAIWIFLFLAEMDFISLRSSL